MAILEFGTAKARAGQKTWGTLQVRQGSRQVVLPTVVVNGSQDGEHVVAIANQHGSEVNGVESLRLVAEQIDPGKLKGSLFLVPCANPYASLLVNEYFPEDVPKAEWPAYKAGKSTPPNYDRHSNPYNMNRRWPGRKGASLVDRMVYEIWNRAVMAPHGKACLFVDIHCHSNPSSVYCTFKRDIGLGVASGIRGVIYTRGDATTVHRNYTHTACANAGIQSLTFELGGQGSLSPVSIEDGRRGIFNLLRFYGMYGGRMEYYPEPSQLMDPWRNDIETRPYKTPSHVGYVASQAGLVRDFKYSFAPVRKGELVAQVVDVHTARVVQECRAEIAGVVYSPPRKHAACEKGESVLRLSIAQRVDPAAYIKRLDPEFYKKRPPMDLDVEPLP